MSDSMERDEYIEAMSSKDVISFLEKDTSEEDSACLAEMKPMLAEFDEVLSIAPAALTEPAAVRKFQLLLAAIDARTNGYELTALAASKNPQKIQQIKLELADKWSITNRAKAENTLEFLLLEGYTKKYSMMMPTAANPNIVGYDYDFVRFFGDSVSPDLVRGWDFGRAANVVRECVAAGYLEEAAGWKYLERIGDAAAEEFRSFAAYGKSYLFGALFWAFSNGGAEEVSAFIPPLADALDELLAPDGIWRRHLWKKA